MVTRLENECALEIYLWRHDDWIVSREHTVKSKTRNQILVLIAVCLSAGFSSCKQSGDFSGGSDRAVNKPKPQTQKPPVTQITQENKCTEARLVGVKSLSSYVNQWSNSKQFDVELTFEPCPYQLNDLALPVKFDLDAYIQFVDQTNKSIPYEMLANNVSQSSGALQQKKGSDLFGKTCQDCFFFQTDFPLEADPKLTKAILRLSLSSFSVTGPSSSMTPATQNFTVPLHVRVGDAPAVTGHLTFTPKGL